jgi:hypothetical protein
MTVPFLQSKTPLLRRLWQGRFPFQVLDAKPVILGVTKSSKTRSWAFPKRGHVDTYASHPRGIAWVAFSGSLWTESIGAVSSVGRVRFGSGFEGEATV